MTRLRETTIFCCLPSSLVSLVLNAYIATNPGWDTGFTPSRRHRQTSFTLVLYCITCSSLYPIPAGHVHGDLQLHLVRRDLVGGSFVRVVNQCDILQDDWWRRIRGKTGGEPADTDFYLGGHGCPGLFGVLRNSGPEGIPNVLRLRLTQTGRQAFLRQPKHWKVQR